MVLVSKINAGLFAGWDMELLWRDSCQVGLVGWGKSTEEHGGRACCISKVYAGAYWYCLKDEI